MPRSLRVFALSGALLLIAFAVGWAQPIRGHNGEVVEFAGILEAHAGGLRLKVTEAGDLLDVPWDRFDLDSLRADHPAIYSARERTLGSRRVVPIKSGVFRNVLSPLEAVHQIDAVLRVPLRRLEDGWYPAPTYRTRTIVELLHEIEGVGLDDMRQRERLFRHFSTRIRNDVLPALERIESEVPNHAFCDKIDRSLFVLPHRLNRFNRTLRDILRTGEVSDSNRLDMQDFLRYISTHVREKPLG